MGTELSPARRRRYAKRLRAEERAWRERNGPVVVTRVESCSGEPSAPERQPVAPGEGLGQPCPDG
jgi:hypothetical protein